MVVLPAKKQVAFALLERSTVLIHLDPRGADVKVPAWFKSQPQLVLRIGLNMAVRIPDLRVEDDAIACTLSFNRTPHFCYLPWSAIYALVGEDGAGMVWPEDVPPEVAAQSAGGAPGPRARAARNVKEPRVSADEPVQSQVSATSRRGEAPRPKRPSLVPLAAGSPTRASTSSEAPRSRSSRIPPPYLRLVK